MRFWNSFFQNPFETGNQLNAGVLGQSASSNHALLITKSALVIKKKSLCLSQSGFSNFAPYVIKMINTVIWCSLTSSKPRNLMAAFPFGMHGTPSPTPPEEPFMAVNGVVVAFKPHATNRMRKYLIHQIGQVYWICKIRRYTEKENIKKQGAIGVLLHSPRWYVRRPSQG